MNFEQVLIQNYINSDNISINIYNSSKIALNFFDGNMIEIGCGFGETTKLLLENCLKKNKKVIGVDPFEDGWEEMPESYGKPYPYKIFQDTTSKFNNLILWKNFSSHPDTLEFLKKYSPFSFCFVDGLQFKKSVLNDLEIMVNLDCKVIAVDDFNRLTDISQVPLAIEEFLKNKPEYKAIRPQNSREIYLIKYDYINSST